MGSQFEKHLKMLLVASSGTYVPIKKSLISPIYKILGGESY